MRKILYILAVAFACGLFAGCKPTENNYRSAYDAAKAKREKADADLNIPATGLLGMDGPRPVPVDGDTVYYLRKRLRPAEGDTTARISRYNVAVSAYRMSTNALRQASDLRPRYPEAFGANIADDQWYVIAAGFPDMKGASEFIRKYRKDNPKTMYIGLPDTPIVIEQR